MTYTIFAIVEEAKNPRLVWGVADKKPIWLTNSVTFASPASKNKGMFLKSRNGFPPVWRKDIILELGTVILQMQFTSHPVATVTSKSRSDVILINL